MNKNWKKEFDSMTQKQKDGLRSDNDYIAKLRDKRDKAAELLNKLEEEVLDFEKLYNKKYAKLLKAKKKDESEYQL
jgi:hypothetical protein